MRRFLGGLCAVSVGVVAFVAIAGGSATANSAWMNARKARAEPPAPALTVACLGGVLGEGHTADYLTIADYPAFAALTAGARHIVICGDSIPPFLPSGLRAGFGSRRR